eukprot:19294-Heterococcus_DN1.PRE.4
MSTALAHRVYCHSASAQLPVAVAPVNVTTLTITGGITADNCGSNSICTKAPMQAYAVRYAAQVHVVLALLVIADVHNIYNTLHSKTTHRIKMHSSSSVSLLPALTLQYVCDIDNTSTEANHIALCEYSNKNHSRQNIVFMTALPVQH